MVATIKSLRKTKKLKLFECHKIAGTFHHADIGIPIGRGLLTTIWEAMANYKKKLITITPTQDRVLRYSKWLFKKIANKPIQVAQLVPCIPGLHGYSDSCKHADGGVWIIPQHDETKKSIVWTCDFPPDIMLLSEHGTISTNDL